MIPRTERRVNQNSDNLRLDVEMSTVEKALRVLDLFSESQPMLRTAEIARLLDWDKSNVKRYVSGLAARGILEQDPRDKSFYLGPALTRLAMLRERTHPVAQELNHHLSELVEITGETAHASHCVDSELVTVALVETKIRGTRVYVDPAEALPFHASGSGIAFLSKTPAERVDELLADKLVRFTGKTPDTRERVNELIKGATKNGYAKAEGSFESDVVGVAAPVVGYDGYAVGALAVATPAARFNRELEETVKDAVVKIATKVSQLYGAI